jgi:hypothetical protein
MGTVFFHQGPAVLETVGMNGRINDFLDTIKNANVALFGFLGAYFYTLGVLYHRYITADLTPAVFLHIGTRIWIAIILSLMLLIVFPDEGWLPSAAFAAGIFPNFLLNAILSPFTRWIKLEWSNDIDLSLVMGISIWHQTRLEEEDIDNVQNLATADIEGLIINTRLGVLRLMHWIDQAVLITHIGKQHVKTFRETGIITATDFREAYLGDNWEREGSAIPAPPQQLLAALEAKEDKKSITAQRLQNMMAAIITDYNFIRVNDF